MKKIKFIISISIVLLFFSTIVWIAIRGYYLNKYSKYTIGHTKRIYYTGKGLQKVEYSYWVDGKEYEGSDPYHDEVVPNGRYWIKFSSKIPDRSELLYDVIVPDNIKIPDGGIDKLPSGETPKFDSLFRKM
ncbi:hypothetical protein [Chitinophaga silvisoli]|uniref:YxeA family protein n=1 Tax=Chitinophaga silvisoli TaxID=2291814 RepID=A0A3E1NWR0_9BACT|nr:hypothetical protein [Chitinophaga silvisoli]RFM32363.1 hypothetical protein DXN04_21995 [Chitinophaga silvisoli]